MSAEVIAIVVSAIGLVLTQGGIMLACCAWIARHLDRIGAEIAEADVAAILIRETPHRT